MKCTSWSTEGRWECNGGVAYPELFGRQDSLEDCQDLCLELNEENGCCLYDWFGYCDWFTNGTAVLNPTTTAWTDLAFTCSDEGGF